MCYIPEVLIVHIKNLITWFQSSILSSCTVRVNFMDDDSTLKIKKCMNILLLYSECTTIYKVFIMYSYFDLTLSSLFLVIYNLLYIRFRDTVTVPFFVIRKKKCNIYLNFLNNCTQGDRQQLSH